MICPLDYFLQKELEALPVVTPDVVTSSGQVKRPTDPNSSKPGQGLGMIGKMHIKPHQFLMQEQLTEKAQKAHLKEELIFSGIITVAWVFAVFGFLITKSYNPLWFILPSYIVSNIFYGFSHKDIYRWLRDNVVKDGPASLWHKCGFVFLGSLFRISYFIPFIGGLVGLPVAIALHNQSFRQNFKRKTSRN